MTSLEGFIILEECAYVCCLKIDKFQLYHGQHGDVTVVSSDLVAHLEKLKAAWYGMSSGMFYMTSHGLIVIAWSPAYVHKFWCQVRAV